MKPTNKENNKMQKNHYNGHRANKIRFECNLTKEEAQEMNKAMQAIGAKTKKDLLMKLINDCLK